MAKCFRGIFLILPAKIRSSGLIFGRRGLLIEGICDQLHSLLMNSENRKITFVAHLGLWLQKKCTKRNKRKSTISKSFERRGWHSLRSEQFPGPSGRGSLSWPTCWRQNRTCTWWLAPPRVGRPSPHCWGHGPSQVLGFGVAHWEGRELCTWDYIQGDQNWFEIEKLKTYYEALTEGPNLLHGRPSPNGRWSWLGLGREPCKPPPYPERNNPKTSHVSVFPLEDLKFDLQLILDF